LRDPLPTSDVNDLPVPTGGAFPGHHFSGRDDGVGRVGRG
jgi:hypothetical protein